MEIIGVTIESGDYPEIPRFSTGILSMDVALGKGSQLGAPYRTLYELYGNTHVGKSTLAYYLAGRAADFMNHHRIAVCDIELLDMEYMKSCVEQSGFNGVVKILDGADAKKKVRDHEDMLMELVEKVRVPDYSAGIFDSVGAYMPTAEFNADFEEAVMGVRAKAMAKFSRRSVNMLSNKEQPAILIIVNHVQAVIGGRGHTTPGGDTMKFLGGGRIYLWQKEVIKSDDEILGYLIEGSVEKLRFGGKGRKFHVINLAGVGISRDLSCLFDCIELGLVRRENTIRIGDKSCGYISSFFQAVHNGNKEKFEPFYELLADYSTEHGFDKPGMVEAEAHVSSRRKAKPMAIIEDTEPTEDSDPGD